MVMDELTQNSLKYNLSISAAFMCFLMKVTGGNAAARVGGSVATIEAKLKLLNTALKEVKKEAAVATTWATSSNNAAEDAKLKLTKLYQANPTLKK
jgi:hypothetical protein